MEIKNENRAKMTNQIKTLRKCCDGETIEEMDETSITMKGRKWENIQEAINGKYKMENEEYQCEA